MSQGEHDARLRFDLVTLDLFQVVAEEGSIAGASARRNIAASAVSRRLAELEAAMDTALLQRHARGIALTPAGEALLRHARSVFALMGRMRDEMGEHAQGVRGHVRIAANTSSLAEFLPEELARFMTHWPGIRVEMQELLSSEIVRAVRDGVADVGIMAENVPAEGLDSLPYREDRLQVVVPSGHVLAGAAALDYAQTLDFPQVGLARESSIQRMLVEEAARRGQVIDLRVHVNSFDVLRRLVQVGIGLAVLPEACIRPFAAAMGLRGIPLRDGWATRRLKLCVRDCATLPAPARLFLRQAAGSGAEAPPP
ncbi:LysR family transcriptional regulator [Teichococcus oryzae]|uniref:LysR family transcriptional regulator n=1 Tax=Teichococcus oryzae TaxID=1608942 RepID=A0A5B2TJE8_9PROT|nr:LysR family transcriptional regulator [Pseudoroseomonas oryzae]KAA2214309.1 LysR family transcriptional regulator [Pseudoroseomonas oryzae]